MRLIHNHKLLGILFVLLLIASAWGTYAIFTKKFADYDEVALTTSKIGLQLPARADVKIRGVIVGEVLDVDTSRDGAEVTLGIYPSKREIIPANVTGSIVPKTLFGEKYVSLVVPEQPAPDPIEAGDTVKPTVVATEVEQVLNDLYPLLRTVEPADLNMTLNALATALEGRGDQLGDNLETVDSYLKRFNPRLPALVEDLRLTSEVSDLYADVLPEVSTILRNSITTTGTLESRSAKLNALFKDVSAFSETTRTFLRDNGDNMIRLGEIGREQFRVFAKYAPEYPCLLKGIVNAGVRQAEAFRGYTLHIVLETLPNQPRPYGPQDQPRFGEDRGPSCLHLPLPNSSQERPLRSQPDMNDGVDEPTGKGTSRAATGFSQFSAQMAGSTAEADLLNSLMGPGLGVSADQVPDLGALLVGPMARGATVSLR